MAIEGPCASGKTFLAAKLANILDANVIHMDHFFDDYPKKGETLGDFLTEDAYSRFKAQVAEPIFKGEEFQYQIYDCHTGEFRMSEILKPKPFTIIEGVRSLHPNIRHIYNLKFYIETDENIRLERLRAREGDNISAFFDKWIPLENEYYATGIKDLCDVIVKGD